MPLPSADIVLPARGRFDLRAAVLSHAGWRLPPWHWVDGRRPVLRRAEVGAGGAVQLLTIRPAPGGVVLRVTGRDATEPEVLAPLAARVRTALQLDADLRPFHRWCRTQEGLRPAARLRLGRLLRGTTLFEDLVTAIIRQDAPWPATVTAMSRLVALGPRCPADRRLRAFPTPQRLAAAGVRGLRAAGLGDHAAPVARLARDVVAGRRDLLALERGAPSRSTAALSRALRAIDGVGPPAAAWLALLLGHADQPLAGGATARRRAAWAPWRGLASWWTLWLACPRPEQQRLRAAPTPSRRRGRAARARRS